MKANNKKVLIGGAVAAVAVGLVFILKKKKSPLAGTGIVPDPSTIGSSPNDKIGGVFYPLKLGSGYRGRPAAENSAVKNLQRNLNMKIAIKQYLGLKKLDVDGDFGPKTETACQKILGVKQVSYSLYKELLAETPEGIKVSEAVSLWPFSFGL